MTTHNSNMTSGKGVYHLPVPGSKSAPKKFKGKYSDIKPFLKHYEKLCVQKEVDDEQEKIENITQYCSRDVREFIEGLPSYKSKDWKLFSQDLMEYFDAERDAKRYKKGDLEAYCKKARHKRMRMRLSHWKLYNREFISIAGWLESRNKVTKEEKAVLYWRGVPKEFRNKLEARLLAIKPDHNLELPFDVEDIDKVAKSLLERNRFDSRRIISETDTEWNSSEDWQGSDTSSSSSDSEEEYERRKAIMVKKRKFAQKKKERESRKVAFKDATEAEESVVKRMKSPAPVKKTSEVEDLIEQMSKLSIHDPTYSVLFYRAYQKDPMIGEIMMNPNERRQSAQRMINRQTNESRTAFVNHTPVAPPVSKTFNERPLPPHMNTKPGNNVFQSTPPQHSEKRCYGCGGFGHSTFFCEKMSNLTSQGIVTKDSSGRYTMANGTFIRRLSPDETLVDAVERLRPPQANYISIIEHEECSEGEEEAVLIATRSTLRNNNTESVNDRQRYKPYRRMDTNHPRFADKENTEGNKDKGKEKVNVPTVPTPVSIDNAIFNPANEDVFMEDTTGRINKEKTRIEGGKATTRGKPPTSNEQEVNQEVYGRMLGLKMVITVEEFLRMAHDAPETLLRWIGTRAEGYQILAEETENAFNEKSAPPIVAFTKSRRAKEALIKLKMECDGEPITAIIDTGSQLNIANTRIGRNILRKPIDVKSKISMGDANGGKGDLEGLLAKVPLNCGGVVTHADIYVGEKVPFDLLLGRPWQRGNFVSIDEREDGTYLLFKDQNLDVRYEILVTPENRIESDIRMSEFLAMTHQTPVYSVNAVLALDDEVASEFEGDSNIYAGIDELSPEKPLSWKQVPFISTEDLTDLDVEMLEDDIAPGLRIPLTEEEEDEMAVLWEMIIDEGMNERMDDDMIIEREDLLMEYVKGEPAVEVAGHSMNILHFEDVEMKEPNMAPEWHLRQILTKRNTLEWRLSDQYKAPAPVNEKALRKGRRYNRELPLRVELLKKLKDKAETAAKKSKGKGRGPGVSLWPQLPVQPEVTRIESLQDRQWRHLTPMPIVSSVLSDIDTRRRRNSGNLERVASYVPSKISRSYNKPATWFKSFPSIAEILDKSWSSEKPKEEEEKYIPIVSYYGGGRQSDTPWDSIGITGADVLTAEDNQTGLTEDRFQALREWFTTLSATPRL